MSTIQSKVLVLLNSVKAEGVKEGKEEKSQARRGWFMRFKERSRLSNMNVISEAAGAHVKAAASYPEDNE